MSGEDVIQTDCGVIGGGLAGCSAALELAEAGVKVDMFVKGRLIEDGNSYLIAGGMASVSQTAWLPATLTSFTWRTR